MTSDQAKGVMKQHGLDSLGDLLKNISWAQVMQIVQAIITIFSSSPVVAKATPGDDSIKAHFQTIKCIAECGESHCA